MSAALEVLAVERTFPDVRLRVRVVSGTVQNRDLVVLRSGGRYRGHGVVAAVRDEDDDRVLRAGESGVLFFKTQEGLALASPGDTASALGSEGGDGGGALDEAKREAIAEDLSRLAPTRPCVMLPLRIETAFAEERGDGRETRPVLRVRATPDALHIRPGLPPFSREDERLRSAYDVKAQSDPAAARRELEAAVGASEARRILAGAPGGASPAAAALPERLVVVATLVSGGGATTRVEAIGGPVPETLPLPFSGETAFEGDRDDPAGWLLDYDRALEVGMAVSLPLPAGWKGKVRRLVVLGLPREGRAALMTNLEVRALAGSAAVAGAGTPTKGTAWPTHPPTAEGLDRLRRLLGWDGATRGASGDLPRAAAALVWHAALGPALRRGIVTPEDGGAEPILAALHERFVEHVRPDGPVPLILADDLPFGVWPICPGARDPLAPPVEIWPALAERVAERRTSSRKAGPWHALVDALSEQEHAVRWQIRSNVEGLFEVHRLHAAQRDDQDIGARRQRVSSIWQAADQTLLAFGVPPGTAVRRATRNVCEPAASLICGPLVAPDAERGGPSPEHLASFPERAPSDLLKWPYQLFPSGREDSPGEVASLLETLLVVALRDRIGAAAAARLSGDPAEAQKLEEAFGPAAGGHAALRGGWQGLVENAYDPLDSLGTVTLMEWIENLLAEAAEQAEMDALTDARALLYVAWQLASAPVEAVHRAVAGALDTGATRLDAWTTAAATARLDRAQGEPLIGAYGMVEDIVRADEREPDTFRLAPSVDHASTAAVLEAAEIELMHRGLGDLADVDLSPERTRAALFLAAGLRAGLTPEELLGRRALRLVLRADEAIKSDDLSRGEIAEAFAENFPLEGKSAPDTAPAGGGRIDGAALLAAIVGEDGAGGGRMTLTLRGRSVNPPEVQTDRIARDLAMATDALNDLLFAEGVHALALGREARAKGAFEALEFGGPVPTSFDVLEAAPPAVSVSCGTGLMTAGVAAEGAAPGSLEACYPDAATAAAALLGPPEGAVTARVGESVEETSSVKVPMAELGLSPLAWAALAAPGQPVETLARAAAAAALAAGSGSTGPAGVVLDVALDEAATDWLWAAGRAAEMLARARPLAREDLPGAVEDDTPSPPPGSGAARHRTVAGALAAALREADDATAPDLLLQAVEAGLLPISPDPPREAAAAGLQAAAHALGAAIEARMTTERPLIASALPDLPDPAAGDASLPEEVFWLDPQQSLTAAPAALRDWVRTAARVRAPLEPLADLILAGAAGGNWRVLQWHDGGEGGPDAAFAGSRIDLSGASDAIEALVLLDARRGPVIAQPPRLRGLLIDRHLEEVARPERTAGLALSAPGPTAQAPQTALACVLPEGGRWSVGVLEDAAGLAFDMAKARGLRLDDLPDPDDDPRPPDAVAGLGQLLPLLWIAEGDGTPGACNFGTPLEREG